MNVSASRNERGGISEILIFTSSYFCNVYIYIDTCIDINC